MLKWLQKNKPITTIGALLTLVISWNVLMGIWDTAALSEEEYAQGQEQQARIDAAQVKRSDLFEIELIDRRLLDLYATADRALTDTKNFPSDVDFKKVWRRAEQAITKAEGRQCELMLRNGTRCLKVEDDD